MQKIKNKKFFLGLIICIFLLAIVFAQLIAISIINHETAQAEQNLNAVTFKNAELENDINYLNTLDAKKEYARQQLGYIEPDEELFKGA